LPQVIKAYSSVLGNAEIPEEVQKNVLITVKAVIQKYSNLNLFEGLSNEQKQNLEKFLKA
jgi:hypothetical protein